MRHVSDTFGAEANQVEGQDYDQRNLAYSNYSYEVV